MSKVALKGVYSFSDQQGRKVSSGRVVTTSRPKAKPRVFVSHPKSNSWVLKSSVFTERGSEHAMATSIRIKVGRIRELVVDRTTASNIDEALEEMRQGKMIEGRKLRNRE
jgi:hypothetical protein